MASHTPETCLISCEDGCGEIISTLQLGNAKVKKFSSPTQPSLLGPGLPTTGRVPVRFCPHRWWEAHAGSTFERLCSPFGVFLKGQFGPVGLISTG